MTEPTDPLKGLRNAKYLNPVCAEDGCQWLQAESDKNWLRAQRDVAEEKLMARLRVLAPPEEQEPTEQPVDSTGKGRLLLNAYGRACYEAGRAAVDPPPPASDAPERDTRQPICRVCGGSGFVAQKQFLDDGYGEVDSCPACDGQTLPQPRLAATSCHALRTGDILGRPAMTDDLRALRGASMNVLCWFWHNWTCIGSGDDTDGRWYYVINCPRCGKVEKLYP